MLVSNIILATCCFVWKSGANMKVEIYVVGLLKKQRFGVLILCRILYLEVNDEQSEGFILWSFYWPSNLTKSLFCGAFIGRLISPKLYFVEFLLAV